MRTPKSKSCRSCVHYDPKKAIDGDFLCKYEAVGHKSKGWGGRVNINDKKCKNYEKHS